MKDRKFIEAKVMELTAEVFRQIVASPAPSSEFGVWEQRRTPRMRLNVEAALMPFSDQLAPETIVAPIRDLSRGGFRFLHDKAVPLGEQFALVLEESEGNPTVVLCTVTYWQPLATELFAIGARFCRVLRAGESDLPLMFEDAVSGELSEARLAS